MQLFRGFSELFQKNAGIVPKIRTEVKLFKHSFQIFFYPLSDDIKVGAKVT